MSRSLQPGNVVGRFRVVSLLGSGGMGEVYLARDESLDRSVALKILPPELVKNDERVRRFVQEAKSASSLSHPNIVTIHEIGEADVDPSTGSGQAAHVHFSSPAVSSQVTRFAAGQLNLYFAWTSDGADLFFIKNEQAAKDVLLSAS